MAVGDLTTLALVKAWLQITGPSSDADLTSLISQISAFVPNTIQRNILTASYTEIRKGNGKDRMQMRQWPIQSVTSVEWTGTRITNSVDLLGGAAGIAHDGRSLILIGYSMPINAPVRVVYSAGYAVVPGDIELAVTELVGEAYTRRTHIGETSHSTGGQTTVSFDSKEMHAAIAAKLKDYTLVVPLC